MKQREGGGGSKSENKFFFFGGGGYWSEKKFLHISDLQKLASLLLFPNRIMVERYQVSMAPLTSGAAVRSKLNRSEIPVRHLRPVRYESFLWLWLTNLIPLGIEM